MPDQNDYEHIVALIEDIEASTPAGETTFVAVPESVTKEEPVHKTYREIIEMIETMETGRRPSVQREGERAAPQVQPHLMTTGVAQSKYAQVPVTTPMQQEQKPMAKAKAQPQEVQTHREAVSKELGNIAKKLGGAKQSFGSLSKKRINIKDLVLPNLSVADQTSELERIIEGLREHIFDVDHIDIVEQEVFGLRQYLQSEQKGKTAQQYTSLEQSLLSLRDQRLNEAVELLHGYGVN